MEKIRSWKTQEWPPPPTFAKANIAPRSHKGRVFIVTGRNTSIGFELCKIPFGTGATITWPPAEGAIKKLNTSIPKATPGRCELRFLHLDLADLPSNNAGLGAMVLPHGSRTKQDLEVQFGVHCVGNLLFTQVLVPHFKPRPHWAWFLGREFGRRYGEDGIVSVAIRPGNLKADSFDGAPAAVIFVVYLLRMRSEPVGGAFTELVAGMSPEFGMEHNGTYGIPFGRIRPDSEIARKDSLDLEAMKPEEEGGLGYVERLWEWCEEMYRPFV
ncbi:hypothetical protein F5Y18DRAFT_419455 [Xylariaceae sp. FL1019]|nr:hypothetical protein F5Y18DRAFT_419455 [Xylariaceae sp. FL1019]